MLSPLLLTLRHVWKRARRCQRPSEAATVVGLKTVVIAEKRKPPVVGWLVAMSGEQKGQDFQIRDGQNILGTSA